MTDSIYQLLVYNLNSDNNMNQSNKPYDVEKLKTVNKVYIFIANHIFRQMVLC